MLHSDKIGKLRIQTPEGINFSFLLAGPMVRCMAWGIDLLCISLLTNIANQVLQTTATLNSDISQAAGIILYFIFSIGYGILMEWLWQGQTLGKRLFRLRVLDENGLKLRFGQLMIRNLLRFIDMLPAFYLVGGITCLWNKKAQRLGDIAANTIVIRTRKEEEPDLDRIFSIKYNSFRHYPHLVARLRQKITPEESSLALQALIRRTQLKQKAKIELFREISDFFREQVLFPEEVTQTLSDEQYVRNVVDILFR